MTGRKTFSILLGMLLMGAVALVSSAQGAEKKSRGADDSHGAKGAAARAVLSNPVSLPAEDADQGASGYAKAELATPPGSTTPIQKLEVKAHDLTANQRYRIEVADRAEGGPNITNLGVFLTDDTGELKWNSIPWPGQTRRDTWC